MINEFLANNRGSAEVRPYVPLCYPKKTNYTYQPLAVLYFHCCLHQFGLKYVNAGFSYLLQLLSLDETDSSTRDVFCIERQAFIQLTISKFAQLSNPLRSEEYRQTMTESTTRELNAIFNDESWGGGENGGHKLSFLHHLFKQLHSSRQAMKIVFDNYQMRCASFPWMKSFKNLLEKPPEIQAHLFPFMIPGQASDGLEATIHMKLLPLVAAISQSPDPSAAIEELEKFCQQQVTKSPAIKYQLRMSLWLHVYYQFYEEKISCEKFAEAILKSFNCLSFEERQRRLVACFLEPNKLMIIDAESPNVINPDEEPLELHTGRVVRKHNRRSRVKFDAVWKLFNLWELGSQDASDIDLRRALVLLVAVSLGLPPERTHLWSHLFHPELIEGTLVCGNMLDCIVESEGLLLDCGCEFTAEGDYGRTEYFEYARRGTLSLHSRLLLLWMSFGALSMSLLTQPTAKQIINGHVISEKQSLRHYCMNQVKTMWVFIRENLNFSDEERTFFVTRTLHKFLEIGGESESDLSHPVCKDHSTLDKYERAFHSEVFCPVLNQFEDKVYLDDKIWQRHELLSSVREFTSFYPVDASYKDFLHTLEHIEGPGAHKIAGNFTILRKFFTEKQRLRVGGLLLPDLIEFYQWLHSELSHLVTFKKATKLKIGHVVKRLISRYSSRYADYVHRLFERVKEKYNKYVQLVGGTIECGACSAVCRKNDLRLIDDDTILATLLSDSDVGGENDALFIVICELIHNQNSFVESLLSSADLGDETPNFLPTNQTTIHPQELAYHNCLLGDLSARELFQYLRNPDDGVPEEAGAELLELIQSYHLYFPGVGISDVSKFTGDSSMMTASLATPHDFRARSMFHFERLQQVVIEAFLIGKPKVKHPTCIRKRFCYQSTAHHSDRFDTYIEVIPRVDQLPIDFKAKMSEAQKEGLEVAFHRLNYQKIIDVLKALQAVVGHVSQIKAEETDETFFKKCHSVKCCSTAEFWEEIYGSSKDVMPELGLRLDSGEVQEFGKIPLSFLHDAVDFFLQKLLNKEYIFAHLPITLKSPLPDDGAQAIKNLPKAYEEKGVKVELVEKLKEIEEVLRHAEENMLKEPQQLLSNYLIEKNFYSADELPVLQLPDTVRVEHYMGVRIVLNRVIIDVQSLHCGDIGEGKAPEMWTEVVSDLWKVLPDLAVTDTTVDVAENRFEAFTEIKRGKEACSLWKEALNQQIQTARKLELTLAREKRLTAILDVSFAAEREKVCRLADVLEDSRGENQDLRNKLRGSRRESISLKAALVQSEKLYEKTGRLLQALNAEVQAKDRRIEELDQRSQAFSAKVEARDRRIEAFETEKVYYSNRLKEMNAEVQAKTRRIGELDKQIQAFSAKVLERNRQLKRLELENDNYLDRLKAMEKRQRQMAATTNMKVTFEDELRGFLLQAKEIVINESNVLGRGSFGKVFLGAWNEASVAVKKFHEILLSEREPHFLNLCRREMLACLSLSKHPNIMSVYGACLGHDGIPTLLVMELMETSLENLLKASKSAGKYLSIREQLDIAEDSIRGIRYLHERKPDPYVHCDIRPTNILIGKDMTAKIGDLGACHMTNASKSQSVGLLSRQYLSPERLSAPADSEEARATLQSDIFSLGVTLCEMIVGGSSEVDSPKMDSLEMDSRAFLPSKIKDLDLRTLCYGMMNSKKEKRPTAREAQEEILQVKQSTAYVECCPKRLVICNSENLGNFIKFLPL